MGFLKLVLAVIVLPISGLPVVCCNKPNCCAGKNPPHPPSQQLQRLFGSSLSSDTPPHVQDVKSWEKERDSCISFYVTHYLSFSSAVYPERRFAVCALSVLCVTKQPFILLLGRDSWVIVCLAPCLAVLWEYMRGQVWWLAITSVLWKQWCGTLHSQTSSPNLFESVRIFNTL